MKSRDGWERSRPMRRRLVHLDGGVLRSRLVHAYKGVFWLVRVRHGPGRGALARQMPKRRIVPPPNLPTFVDEFGNVGGLPLAQQVVEKEGGARSRSRIRDTCGGSATDAATNGRLVW